MNKIEFFNDLEEIVTDKLLISDDIHDLYKETENNTWSISISEDLALKITVEDFMNFFDKVIFNRQKQIRGSNGQNEMFFYAWFDGFSGQVKFSLISCIHQKLPFGCEIQILNELNPVIQEFLTYSQHDGIEIIEDDTEDIQDEEEHDYILPVFLLKIGR